MQLRRTILTSLCLGAVALGGAALLPACSSSDDSGGGTTGDAGNPNIVVNIDGSTQKCAPGTRSCKSDTVATACGADGQSQTDQPCGTGQRCSNGVCLSDTNPNVCTDATTALRRNAAGAFEVVKCPAGTACVDAGTCKGAFVVGATQCAGIQNLGTSTDGLTLTLTACAAGTLCVATGDVAGVPAASCQASECSPGVPNNLAFCGNPKAPTANFGKVVTKCVATPAGYKYVSAVCPGAALCVPGSKGNNNNNTVQPTDATCATSCVAGTSRCSGTNTVACAADGTFSGTVTACSFGKTCLPSPTDPSKAVCGDAACISNAGACDGDNFRACDATGTLGAGAPCALGVCRTNGLGGGFCSVECTAGEERCAGNNSTSFQTCVNGRWSATATSCPSTAACVTYSLAGKSAKLCGAECAPGAMRCTLADGGPGNAATETCNAAGKWGAPTACAIGTCQTAGSTAACVAECIPNSLVCSGNNVGVPGTPFTGKDSFVTCTAAGLLGTTVTACTANTTFCRSKNGRAIVPAGATNACNACVGSAIAGGNENGLVDSRCANAAGDNTGTETSQICAANNTWTANLTTCANGCTAPAQPSGPPAPVCNRTRNGNEFRSESYYAARKRGSCLNTRRGASTPTVCGAVPDCCGSQCTQPVPAKPASCNAP